MFSFAGAADKVKVVSDPSPVNSSTKILEAAAARSVTVSVIASTATPVGGATPKVKVSPEIVKLSLF